MNDQGEGPVIERNGRVSIIRIGEYSCRINHGVGSFDKPYEGFLEYIGDMAVTLWHVAEYRGNLLGRSNPIYFRHNQVKIKLEPGAEEPIVLQAENEERGPAETYYRTMIEEAIWPDDKRVE